MIKTIIHLSRLHDNSVEYATNVYIIDENGTKLKFLVMADWIKEDIYADNQKVKDVLNAKLKDPKYSDYYYAVNVKSITVESTSEIRNYYVFNHDIWTFKT